MSRLIVFLALLLALTVPQPVRCTVIGAKRVNGLVFITYRCVQSGNVFYRTGIAVPIPEHRWW